MTDLSIFITVAGLCLSVATFYFGRQSVTKADGKAAGALETDLRYIKEVYFSGYIHTRRALRDAGLWPGKETTKQTDR